MTRTIQSQSLRRVGLLVALAAAYFVAGRLGLQLAVVNPNATAVWPPTGIALAALLLAGYEVWPAIMVGAFLVNVTVSGSVSSAVAVAALLVCIVVIGIAVFDGLFPWRSRHYPLEFLCVPLLLWAAFRFEPREAATAVLVMAGVAIAGTLAGFGPFARSTYGESLLLVQAFTGVTAIMTLVLAAAVAERREAEERLRRLAVSDPLTGLSNYRQLVQALETEIKRSSRTDRSFAVVLMDLDGLKTINDRFGHLVGSLALRRVAETLLGSCRGIDTAARFGGDEFALVLPETGDAAAWHVARRVAERVARDGEQPVISVSVGVAVHPRDGASLEGLLNAADRSLYDTKSRQRHRAQAS